MIINEDEIENYVKAGRIAAEALTYGESLIKEGVKVIEILDKIEEFILSKRGELAFPPQISINNTAAHFCPKEGDTTILSKGDLIKLDIGVHIEGCIADTALTVDLGDNKELVAASREALNNALKIIKPGVKVREIGKVIEDTIRRYGFIPVRNLSGHGLSSFNVHSIPTIPNYDNGDEYELQENEVVAIEPFASKGRGVVEEKGEPTIFSLTGKERVRGMYAREILRDISSRLLLPFTERWLTKRYGKGKAIFGLKEMIDSDVVLTYPPLVDKEGLVSQAEHTVIVKKDKNIITTQL